MQERHDKANWHLLDRGRIRRGASNAPSHQESTRMKSIGKHVVRTVLVLSGLCAVNIALAGANKHREQKSDYDMKTVERGRTC